MAAVPRGPASDAGAVQPGEGSKRDQPRGPQQLPGGRERAPYRADRALLVAVMGDLGHGGGRVVQALGFRNREFGAAQREPLTHSWAAARGQRYILHHKPGHTDV